MIVVEGNCRRGAWVFAFVAGLFLLTITVVVLTRILVTSGWIEVTESWFETRYGQRMFDNGGLVLLVFCAALLAGVWGRLYFNSSNLTMDAIGLRFPFLPGMSWGRRVAWENLRSVDWVRDIADQRVTRAAIGSAVLMSRDAVVLILYLNCTRSVAWRGNQLLRVVYGLNDFLGGSRIPGNENIIAECITVSTCRAKSLIATINALIREPNLRHEYCNTGTTYSIEEGQNASVCARNLETGQVTILVRR